jgi:hypothetical protein
MKVLNYKNLKFINDNIFIIMIILLGIIFFTLIIGINVLEYFKKYKEGMEGIGNKDAIPNVSVNGDIYYPSTNNTNGVFGKYADGNTSASGATGSYSPSGNNDTYIPPTEPSIYVGPSGNNCRSREPIPNGPSYYNIYNIYSDSSGNSGSIGPTGPAGPSGNSQNNMSVYLNFNKDDVKSSNDVKSSKLPNLYNGIKNYNVNMIDSPEIKMDAPLNTGVVSLNGTSSYLSIDNFSVTSNGFSASFICKNKSSGWSRIFDFGNGSNSDNILFSIENGPAVYYGSKVYQPYDTERKINTNFPWKINDGTWKHVVWTCTYAPPDSNTSIWHIYINNKLVYTAYNGLYPTPLINRKQNYIGKSNWTTKEDPLYKGLIGDFRIYNEVLNVDDVNILYNNNIGFMNKSTL